MSNKLIPGMYILLQNVNGRVRTVKIMLYSYFVSSFVQVRTFPASKLFLPVKLFSVLLFFCFDFLYTFSQSSNFDSVLVFITLQSTQFTEIRMYGALVEGESQELVALGVLKVIYISDADSTN